MSDKIVEMFSPPTGLEPEIELYGTTFYSSQRLKDSFIVAFGKSSKGKHVYPEISKLIKNGSVLPCFRSKNILSFLKHKLIKNPNSQIQGFYNLEKRKVIILIDNNITLFGTSSNNELASTTLHECMHLVAGKNLPKFIQIFKAYLDSFYSEFFKDYLSLQEAPKKETDEVIKYIARYEKMGPRYANKDLTNYFNFLTGNFKSLTRLDERTFQIRIANIVIALKLFIVSPTSLFKNTSKFEMIFSSLDRAYQNSFGKRNKYTMPIQELISVSEVACVLSEMSSKDPVIKKLLNIAT